MENREFFNEIYELYELYGPIFDEAEKREMIDRHLEMVNDGWERFRKAQKNIRTTKALQGNPKYLRRA